MIKTTVDELGEAYNRAYREMHVKRGYSPITPRMAGAWWREDYGLYHRYEHHFLKEDEFWIEFPNDADYTMFILRFA